MVGLLTNFTVDLLCFLFCFVCFLPVLSYDNDDYLICFFDGSADSIAVLLLFLRGQLFCGTACRGQKKLQIAHLKPAPFEDRETKL